MPIEGKWVCAGAKGRSGSANEGSQAEYEQRELLAAHRDLQDIEKEPLADRKEAQESFFEAMASDPEIVGERIGWLLDGNYGYGAMLMAKRSLASRGNREAQLTQLVGAFEWKSPPRMTAAAWKKLTSAEKTALDREVKRAIADAESEA